MGAYPFIIATALLVLLSACLLAGYGMHRRILARESDKNRQKQQQVKASSEELKNLKREAGRKCDIAVQLPQITKKLTEKLPPDAYPAIAVRCIKEFFHARTVGYFVPAEDSSDYTLSIGVGFPQDWLGKVRIHPREGILGMALQKRMVISGMDLHTSAGRRSTCRSLEDMDDPPDFVAPVFGVTGILGVLVIAGCPFPLDGERVYVSMLGDLLSTALQNATLLDPKRDGKWVDHLTGISNRNYFLQRFEGEIRRTRNYLQAAALFMFDIDNFKKINDTYGHHAGDVVIKRLSKLVQSCTRGSDLLGRYGGDEFMLLITSTTVEQAVAFAEKMRETISITDFAIPTAETPLRITISGGIAMFPTHGYSTTELMHAADNALYGSKRQGRNRILLATSAGMNGENADGSEPDRETPISTEQSDEIEADIIEFPLGKPGGDLNV